jgi:prevent-host-death family protein
VIGMAKFGMHEAKTKLSQLVERAEAGEEIVIARKGSPAARLVPIRDSSALGEARGAWRGRVRIADDFDQLPDEVAAAFEGE